MTRPTLFLLLIVPVSALAAPVPTPSDKELVAKLWGKVYAPSDKFEFKPQGKLLTIRTDGEPSRKAGTEKPTTIPRVSRVATGDFEAIVRVASSAAPNPTAKWVGTMPSTKAGLFVEADKSLIELSLFQYRIANKGVANDQPQQAVWFQNNGNGSHQNHADPSKPLYFRVTRKDAVLTFAYSHDGKEWLGQDKMSAKVQGDVSVGVFLSHTTQQPVDATFADFVVEKANEKEEPKK